MVAENEASMSDIINKGHGYIRRHKCSKSTVRGERGLVESPFMVKCFKKTIDNKHYFMLDYKYGRANRRGDENGLENRRA